MTALFDRLVEDLCWFLKHNHDISSSQYDELTIAQKTFPYLRDSALIQKILKSIFSFLPQVNDSDEKITTSLPAIFTAAKLFTLFSLPENDASALQPQAWHINVLQDLVRLRNWDTASRYIREYRFAPNMFTSVFESIVSEIKFDRNEKDNNAEILNMLSRMLVQNPSNIEYLFKILTSHSDNYSEDIDDEHSRIVDWALGIISVTHFSYVIDGIGAWLMQLNNPHLIPRGVDLFAYSPTHTDHEAMIHYLQLQEDPPVVNLHPD